MNILDNNDVQDDPNVDYLSELVGEGKKYKSTADLAKAYAHADRTINVMKPRMDEMRQDYLKVYEENQAKGELATLIAQLRENQQPANSNNPANEVREPAVNVDELKNSILSEVPKMMGAYEAQRRFDENANTVQSKLKERFGANYSNIVREQLEDLGLSEAEFNNLARTSPKTILKTLGVDDNRRPDTQVPRGQSSFGSRAEPKRTWSYYQALKKENPKLYLDPKTANEMVAMAEKYGDDFYDGDFNRFN